MNKKIEELIKQHGFMADEDLIDFAKIIINECLNVIHSNKQCPDGFIGSHEVGFQLGCNRSIENIKQHFGIN